MFLNWGRINRTELKITVEDEVLRELQESMTFKLTKEESKRESN